MDPTVLFVIILGAALVLTGIIAFHQPTKIEQGYYTDPAYCPHCDTGGVPDDDER